MKNIAIHLYAPQKQELSVVYGVISEEELSTLRYHVGARNVSLFTVTGQNGNSVSFRPRDVKALSVSA